MSDTASRSGWNSCIRVVYEQRQLVRSGGTAAAITCADGTERITLVVGSFWAASPRPEALLVCFERRKSRFGGAGGEVAKKMDFPVDPVLDLWYGLASVQR
jgi:hypothetical protein